MWKWIGMNLGEYWEILSGVVGEGVKWGRERKYYVS